MERMATEHIIQHKSDNSMSQPFTQASRIEHRLRHRGDVQDNARTLEPDPKEARRDSRASAVCGEGFE